MNKSFFVPPSPNWYNSQILACAPDNTLIYGSKNEIVIIHPTPDNESSKIEIIPDEGSYQKVVCVDVTPKWDSPNKWVLCSWENNIVKIWDIKKLQWKKFNSTSKGEKDNLVGARFLSVDRFLSVTESGNIFIYLIHQMKFTQLTNIFQGKVTVTSFLPSPHTSNIAAFGLKNGLIIIADLRKNGTLLHKLRGHTGEVISLSWCPSPVNVFPQKPGNRLQCSIKDHNKKEQEESNNNASEPEKGEPTESTNLKPNQECISEIDHDKGSSENQSNTSVEIEAEIPDASTSKQLSKMIDKKLAFENDENTNSLIEKIEDFIIEAEEKAVEHNTAEITNSEGSVKEETAENEENKLGENLGADGDKQSTEVLPIESNKMLAPIIGEKQDASNTEKSRGDAEKSSRASEEPKKELLLASCGKDSYINIWRANTDGRLQCFFKLADKKPYNKHKKTQSSWFAIKWITPFSLLVGTNKGEILKYILPKPMDGKKDHTLVHNEHNNFIFAIAADVPILTEENWNVEHEVKIWTFAYDMFILNTVLDSKITHLTSLETFCALVNCMTYSPVDPNRIALGLSNGNVKIWNSNISASPKFFSTANYNVRIYGKISYLDWHPTNELIIAFCSEEGTIGLININSKQKAMWFRQYFTNTIHRIQWAPYRNKTCLYAISKGELVCFDPDDTKGEPIRVKVEPDTVPYNFSWKLDMSTMLVSHNCGKISMYDKDLNVKASYFNKKKISSIHWHPDSESTKSQRSSWVASAVDNVVYVFDFAEVAEKTGTLDIEHVFKTKFSSHYGVVKSLAWNHFIGDQLVTAGDDGLAFVYDVSTETILSTYCDKNFQSIKTIMWSPTEEDLLIMSMSRFSMLMGWKSTDHKGTLTSEILKEYEDHVKMSKRTNQTTTHKDEESSKKAKKVIKSAKTVILPTINTGTSDVPGEKAKILKHILEESENKDIVEKSNFGKLFGSKQEVLSLLDVNEKLHKEKGKLEAAATVSAFKGNLQSHIKEAIEQYAVTPLLISLAPSVSLSLWQQACETYAGQLRNKLDADPLEVALYYMSCQNIVQAIEYLCEKELFKEALCLAKIRLPHDSVIIDDIVRKWAQFSSICGNLETGALCYIKLGLYEDAVRSLFRRNDLDILSITLELARKTGNSELLKAVEYRYNAFSKNDKTEIEKSNELIGEDIKEEKEKIVEDDNKVADNKEKIVEEEEKHTEHNNKIAKGTCDELREVQDEQDAKIMIEEGTIKIETNVSIVEISPESNDVQVNESEGRPSDNTVY